MARRVGKASAFAARSRLRPTKVGEFRKDTSEPCSKELHFRLQGSCAHLHAGVGVLMAGFHTPSSRRHKRAYFGCAHQGEVSLVYGLNGLCTRMAVKRATLRSAVLRLGCRKSSSLISKVVLMR
jgi:hypothetical protein